ncbi:arginine deiminase family protein [soil metagenome]
MSESPKSPFHVASEVAPLRQVLVHTPGEEMALVSPERKLELLFDDILFAEVAREEHALMCALFERVIGQADGVLQLSDLLLEAFQKEDARAEFVTRLINALPERHFEAYESELLRLSAQELHRFALTGESPLTIKAPPLPNLIFTRDLSAVVGGTLILSHAATEARMRDSVIIAVIARHHERFAPFRDSLVEVPPHVSFEGGDLLVVNEEVVLIGQSERTSLGGVMAVTQALLERTAVRHVLMVNLPRERSCMHLDTVFTFADEETCVVYPPIIEQQRYNVFHITPGERRMEFTTRILPNLKTALDELTGRNHNFIPCGGSDPLNQRREQWTDGANLFATAPGMVVGYERNRKTFEAMRDSGFHVVDADSFLDFYADGQLPQGERIAIRLPGNELSRGRGGPRCMTMPLRRGDA